jgi:hypothetical protein
MIEGEDFVSDRINECVQYLRRDEDGTEEGSSDRLVENHHDRNCDEHCHPHESHSRLLRTTTVLINVLGNLCIGHTRVC